MPITVQTEFKNLPLALQIPEGDLVVFTGGNNSGKSAILQFLNIHSPLRSVADYVSPRRFDLSNEVAIALNTDQELQSMWTSRKDANPSLAELSAPDPIRELVSLPNASRDKIIEWHNRYFGELKVERSKPDNDYAPPRVTIDGRLATQQGSGSRAVLSILCSLLHPAREVILIDEPEIGIEPQVQKRLAQLIRRVVAGADGLPKKRVYIATHSHLFLDKETLENNWVVTKDASGKATLAQILTPEELHATIYRLLGNSPEDLFFPDNMLIVEGPSDEVYWRKLMTLLGTKGIAVHFTEGDSRVTDALPAIEQMLKTQANVPWYRDRLCICVDGSVPTARVDEWRKFLGDDGTRVRVLAKNGIEHYYPRSILGSLTALGAEALPAAIDAFIDAIRKGARRAILGSFTGSKRELAVAVVAQMEPRHLDEVDGELLSLAEVVKERRFSAGSGSGFALAEDANRAQ